MSLIALPADYLELNKRLPFGVFDAFGRLLVAAGQVIDDEHKLTALLARDLFVDDQEAGPLKDSLVSTAGQLIEHNATLEVIAAAKLAPARTAASHRGSSAAQPAAAPRRMPALSRSRVAAAARTDGRRPVFDTGAPLPRRCEALAEALSTALRDAEGDPLWLEHVKAVRAALLEFTRHHRNAALYLLFQHAAHTSEQYCAHHALLCAVICDAVAATLAWAPEARDRLGVAALAMNASMAQLQDALAQRDDPLRPLHKQQIASHAQRSADLLARAGVQDDSLLTIVRMHHDDTLPRRPLDALNPPQRLTRLLMTVDRFAARVSRRGSRHPMSPVLAARDLCNGEDGRPDEFGATLLRVIGMYPPGSYVRLETGEVGVVLAPGRRMNQPLVAVFINPRGMPTTEPLLRDTAQAGRAVVEAAAVADIHVRVAPDRALKLAP